MNNLERALDQKGFHTVRYGRAAVKALDSKVNIDTIIIRRSDGQYKMTDIHKKTGLQGETVVFASIDQWLNSF